MNGPRNQDTYWHLAGRDRVPSEYEIVSSKLLYYPGRGFEVNLPIGGWYREYQQSSALQMADWESFADPRQTTYADYVARRAQQETYLDSLFAAQVDSAYDRALPEKWRRALARVFAPLRYPCHGLQMIAAYCGQMAPSGRIAIVALFQAADEMRRIQRIAARIAKLQESFPDFGRDGKQVWQEDRALQPLRKAVERLLVTYDWGEALVGLNLALKPAIDACLSKALVQGARQHGDPYLCALLRSFEEDSEWQRQWTKAFIETAVADRPANRAVIDEWAAKWQPLSTEAAKALEEGLVSA